VVETESCTDRVLPCGQECTTFSQTRFVGEVNGRAVGVILVSGCRYTADGSGRDSEVEVLRVRGFMRSDVVGTVVLLLALAVPAPAQTPAASSPDLDQIIAANLEARGGLERLRAVQAVRQVSRATFSGLTADMVQTVRRPNLVRQELTAAGQTVVTAFDGTTAWTINPLATGTTEPRPLDGPAVDMLKEQAVFDSPFVDYGARGYAIALLGSEPLDGRPAFHLRVTSATGLVQHIYLDPQTMLERRVVVEGPAWTLVQDLSDYRAVDGLTLPFLLTTSMNGQPLGQIVVSRIEVDPVVDDAIFRMPSGD